MVEHINNTYIIVTPSAAASSEVELSKLCGFEIFESVLLSLAVQPKSRL